MRQNFPIISPLTCHFIGTILAHTNPMPIPQHRENKIVPLVLYGKMCAPQSKTFPQFHTGISLLSYGKG